MMAGRNASKRKIALAIVDFKTKQRQARKRWLMFDIAISVLEERLK